MIFETIWCKKKN